MHIRNYQEERGCSSDEARVLFLNEVREDVRRFIARVEAAEAGFMPQFEDFVVSAPGIRRAVQGQPSPADAVTAYVDEARFLQALGL